MTAPHAPSPDTPGLPAAAEAARASLVPTPLLDVPAALALLGDNADIYQDIARAYLDELARVAARLPELLAPGQLNEAARAMHTLKGLSLTVGAVHLGGVCRIGESQLKAFSAGVHPDGTALALLHADLDQAIRQTRHALEDSLRRMAGSGADAAAAPSAAPLDAALLVQDLAHLRSLLAASDMQAVDWHAALRKNHPAAHRQLAPLQAAVDAFDFPQAVVQCDTLIKTIRPR